MSMTAEPTQPPVPSPAHGAATMLTDTVFPGSTQMAGQADPQLLGSEQKSRTAPVLPYRQPQTGTAGTTQRDRRCSHRYVRRVSKHRYAPLVKLPAVSYPFAPPFPPSGTAPGPSAEPGADSFHQTASRQDGKAGAAGGIPVIESESPYLSFAPVSCKIEQILQFERSPPWRSGGLSCSGSN